MPEVLSKLLYSEIEAWKYAQHNKVYKKQNIENVCVYV